MPSRMTLLCLTRSTSLLISAGTGVGSVELSPLLSSIMEMTGSSEQFECLDGRMPFFIMHDLNAYLNWQLVGLLFHPPRLLIRLKRVSKLSGLSFTLEHIEIGLLVAKGVVGVYKLMDIIITIKPNECCLASASCQFVFLIMSPLVYLSMDSKSVSVCERFLEDIGAFEYLPIRLRKLQMSKSLFIMRMNLHVASLPSNCSIFWSSLRYSIASTTDVLSVSAAILTLILFFAKSMCLADNLLAKNRLSWSCWSC